MRIKNPIATMMLVATLVCCRESTSVDISDTKIVGGQVVQSSSDPVMASTIALLSGGRPFCTGTLIGPNQIVSAAHCFTSLGNNMQVGGGVSGQALMGLIVTGVKIHPRYTGTTNDIAVVTFRGTLPAGFAPVTIASAAVSTPNMPMIMAGYGDTSEQGGGAGMLRKTTGNIMSFSPYSREFTMVPGTGKGTCYGDSGGPVYIENGLSLQLIGATSRGENCDITDGEYTDVRLFQGWMKCTFTTLGAPLSVLLDDASTAECTGGVATTGMTSTTTGITPATTGTIPTTATGTVNTTGVTQYPVTTPYMQTGVNSAYLTQILTVLLMQLQK